MRSKEQPHARLKTPKPTPEKLPETRDPEILKLRGFAIDDTVYPHFAYKGPRFAPNESQWCWTYLEAKLQIALENSQSHHEYRGWGDAWEREVESQIEAALEAAKIAINYQKGNGQ